jgi:hypothetical protein
MVSIIKTKKDFGFGEVSKNSEGIEKRRPNRKRPEREIKKYGLNEATGR